MKDTFEKPAHISQLVICIMLIFSFLSFFQLKLTLVSDLIPESVVNTIYEPYAKQGLILSIGLLISVILRMYKKFKIAFFVDVISFTVSSLFLS